MRNVRNMSTSGKYTVIYTQVGRGRAVLGEQIRLSVFLTVIGCILLALETTALSRIPLHFMGMGRAAPSLGLLFCMATGFLYDERVGGIVGLVAGFLADCMDYTADSPLGGIMILPLVWFLFGFLAGAIGKQRLAHNLPSFLVFATVGAAAEAAITVAVATLQYGGLPPSTWLLKAPLPTLVLTVVFAPVVYGIVGMGNRERRKGTQRTQRTAKEPF